MLRLITASGPRPARRRLPSRTIPRLESLEDRRLLATFNPSASAADGDPDSLRAAIIAANSNGQDNTIDLEAGTYQLTIANTAGQENAAAQGDLDLTSIGRTITIQGQGAGATIIDAGGLDRAFQIMPEVNVVISGLTIQNGVARDAGYAGALPDMQSALGGGILNEGTLALDGVVIQNCTAAGGAGPTVVGNFGLSAEGGGIYNVGALTLNQSIIRNDLAAGGEGGSGPASMEDPAPGGGGGDGFGGGLYNGGSLTMSQSTVAASNAFGGLGGDGGNANLSTGSNAGPGGMASGGGLYADKFSTRTIIIDFTIAGNGAVGGTGGQGGAGGSPAGPAPGAGGAGGDGGLARGGGIAASNTLSLDNSTVAANRAQDGFGGPGGLGGAGQLPDDDGPHGSPSHGAGGGIWAPGDPNSPAMVTSVSSLIASNATDASNSRDADAGFSASDTLVQDGDGAAGITNGDSGNIVGMDPMLGPLQDNGGPTPTMALLPGSPAIDAGSNPLGLTADQRGDARVVGAAADIGAFELGASPPTGGGGSGGTGGGGGRVTVSIVPAVIKVKGHRAIRVTDPATGAVRFTVYPFGRGYRGKFAISTVTVDGVEDLVVRRPRGHKKFITAVFSGIDGSPLPSSLA